MRLTNAELEQRSKSKGVSVFVNRPQILGRIEVEKGAETLAFPPLRHSEMAGPKNNTLMASRIAEKIIVGVVREHWRK